MKRFCALAVAALALNAPAAEVTFGGLTLTPVTEIPEASTGLQAVYVLPQINGVTASFTSESGGAVSWQRFSAMGAAYAEPVPSTQSGRVSTLGRLEGNMGYVVTDGTSSAYFWVVDYASAPFWIEDVTLDPAESECYTAWLEVEGDAPALTYYTINGVPKHLDREVTLTYQTLEFDKEAFEWRQVTHTEQLEQMGQRVACPRPLCQTDFTISGDKYARAWGRARSASSPFYDPTAVAVEIRATQAGRDNDNEVKDDAALGGSGPVDLTFEAKVTDAVVFRQWELSRDPEFNQVFMRSDDLEFSHTFRDQGTTYVRFQVANDAGTCEAEGETFEVFVGESMLKCPNAFSPGASEGVNDLWKVSYKSILTFDCQIFDRNGRRLAHLTDPSQGWDGKVRGKTVPTGVYFYVIRAEGTDGKKYKLSGDINVVGFKKGNPATGADNF